MLSVDCYLTNETRPLKQWVYGTIRIIYSNDWMLILYHVMITKILRSMIILEQTLKDLPLSIQIQCVVSQRSKASLNTACHSCSVVFHKWEEAHRKPNREHSNTSIEIPPFPEHSNAL